MYCGGRNSVCVTVSFTLVSQTIIMSGAVVSQRCTSSALRFFILFILETRILRLSVGLLQCRTDEDVIPDVTLLCRVPDEDTVARDLHNCGASGSAGLLRASGGFSVKREGDRILLNTESCPGMPAKVSKLLEMFKLYAW